jgi:phosphatidylserine decarboxylase
MLGQAVIDRLLQVSAPLTRPATKRLERMWLEALAHPKLSRTMGRVAEAALPRPLLGRLIDAWIKAYDVDMSIAEVPPEGFNTFDAFFTRRLRPGTRPVDHDPDVLVSPADSVLKGFGVVDPRGRIPEVKGRSYALEDLIGGSLPDDAYIGGTWGVYYLSPRDYHRVHAPGAGVVTSIRELDGTTYPVNELGVRRVEGLFVKNKRTVFAIDGDDVRMLLVMVGATNVGRITTAVATGDRVDKGQELGTFHLGSTVVLLNSAAAGFDYQRVHQGEWVRMGQAVLQRG